jgi:hypothetical protein
LDAFVAPVGDILFVPSLLDTEGPVKAEFTHVASLTNPVLWQCGGKRIGLGELGYAEPDLIVNGSASAPMVAFVNHHFDQQAEA